MNMNSTTRNLRHEIPARAFINAQIIQEVRSTPEFQQAIRNVLESSLYYDQGFTQYQFENPAYVVSLLYCLIVVPKELWAKSSSDIYREIEKHNPSDLFEVQKDSQKPGGTPTYRLIHRLRNAIAHAKFAVDTNMIFTFWDMPPGVLEKEWIVRIDVQSLMVFISVVGASLANEGLRSRHR